MGGAGGERARGAEEASFRPPRGVEHKEKGLAGEHIRRHPRKEPETLASAGFCSSLRLVIVCVVVGCWWVHVARPTDDLSLRGDNLQRLYNLQHIECEGK